jgi:ssDNA-binding Zn-finger/Zn-ribbon topoisomerase 1
MQETSKEVSFALCPKCFWIATYFDKSEKNCPQCESTITMQSVIVKVSIEETLQKGVLLKYA